MHIFYTNLLNDCLTMTFCNDSFIKFCLNLQAAITERIIMNDALKQKVNEKAIHRQWLYLFMSTLKEMNEMNQKRRNMGLLVDVFRVVPVWGPHSELSDLHIWFGTGFLPDAFLDTALLFYSNLAPALRNNYSVAQSFPAQKSTTGCSGESAESCH